MHYRYQRHRWQIFPPFSLALLIPVANLPPVSTIQAANLPPVSTTPVANNGYNIRLQTSEIELEGKNLYRYVNSITQRCSNKIIKIFQLEDFLPFARHRWQTLSWNISANFQKNSKGPYLYNQGLGGKWVMKKTISKKSRDTVPVPRRLFITALQWLAIAQGPKIS